jgi:predicted phosphodiesterase
MSHDQRRIVVLSDLHANARALEACLDRASMLGFDELVILGDLLTYGADVGAVVDSVAELSQSRGAKLLVGNHDWLYRDLPKANRHYYETLPGWLRESIDWTLDRLDTKAFEALPWQEEVTIGPVLFSHANPFGSRNFRYLNGEQDVRDAAMNLGARSVLGGCFGHTHRSTLQAVHLDSGKVTDHGKEAEWSASSARFRFIANPGSVGQPRGGEPLPSFLRLVVDEMKVHATLQRGAYDVAAHVAAVEGMGLTTATREKLVGFFACS